MNGVFDEGVEEHAIYQNRKRWRNVDPESIEFGDKRSRGVGVGVSDIEEEEVVDKVANDLKEAGDHDKHSAEDGKEVNNNVNSLHDAEAVLATFEVGCGEKEVGVEKKDDGDKYKYKKSRAKNNREDDDDKKAKEAFRKKQARKTEKYIEKSVKGIVPVSVMVNVHSANREQNSGNAKMAGSQSSYDDDGEDVEVHYCCFEDCADPVLNVYPYETVDQALRRHKKADHEIGVTRLSRCWFGNIAQRGRKKKKDVKQKTTPPSLESIDSVNNSTTTDSDTGLSSSSSYIEREPNYIPMFRAKQNLLKFQHKQIRPTGIPPANVLALNDKNTKITDSVRNIEKNSEFYDAVNSLGERVNADKYVMLTFTLSNNMFELKEKGQPPQHFDVTISLSNVFECSLSYTRSVLDKRNVYERSSSIVYADTRTTIEYTYLMLLFEKDHLISVDPIAFYYDIYPVD